MRKISLMVAFVAGAFAALSMPVSDAQLFRRNVRPATFVVPQPMPERVVVEQAKPQAVTPAADATARKTGIVFKIAVRQQLRKEFRSQGYGILKSMQMANQASDEMIDGLIADAEALSGVKVVGTAIGDGKIIDAILDFFKSPQGQALIEALIKLILSLLANAVPGSAEFYVLLDMLANVSSVYNL